MPCMCMCIHMLGSPGEGLLLPVARGVLARRLGATPGEALWAVRADAALAEAIGSSPIAPRSAESLPIHSVSSR